MKICEQTAWRLCIWGMGTAGLMASATPTFAASPTEPTVRELMGLNTSAAVNAYSQVFNPSLYKPVANTVRDYHSVGWDFGSDSSLAATVNFRDTINNANWDTIYTQWKDQGFKIMLCVQFDNLASWSNMAVDSYNYGKNLATFTKTAYNGQRLVDSIQIGNEPGNANGYTDAQYRTILTNMAQGIRDADPQMTIVTAALTTKSGGSNNDYMRNATNILGSVSSSLYDVIDTHSYAHKQGYPTWEGTYPENPTIGYLTDIQNLINWRNTNAPGKPVTVSEFGYDAGTKPPPTSGTFSQFKDVTEKQQAQWNVRSYLMFASMDVNRADLYYYNDADGNTVYAASGLTRNYVPKPSYYSIAHLLTTLGDYKYERTVQALANNVYVLEFSKGATDLIWAVWSPTGTDRTALTTLTGLPKAPDWAQLMPETSAPAASVSFNMQSATSLQMTIGESVSYLHFSVPEPGTMGVMGIAGITMLMRRRQKA